MNKEEIKHVKSEAGSYKSGLMYLMRKLERIGAIREAKSLGTIIGNLEAWQNK